MQENPVLIYSFNTESFNQNIDYGNYIIRLSETAPRFRAKTVTSFTQCQDTARLTSRGCSVQMEDLATISMSSITQSITRSNSDQGLRCLNYM